MKNTRHSCFSCEFSVCPMSSVCREGRPQYFQRKIQSIQTRFLIRLYVYSTQILSVHLYWISPSLRFLLIYTTVKNPSIHAAIICNANKTIVRTDALVFLFTAWLIPVKDPQMAAAIPKSRHRRLEPFCQYIFRKQRLRLPHMRPVYRMHMQQERGTRS